LIHAEFQQSVTIIDLNCAVMWRTIELILNHVPDRRGRLLPGHSQKLLTLPPAYQAIPADSCGVAHWHITISGCTARIGRSRANADRAGRLDLVARDP
jgi:hypothetical protein